MAMNGEETTIFKGYLRGLMRQLKLLKNAIDSENVQDAKKLIDEIIEDTQNDIED